MSISATYQYICKWAENAFGLERLDCPRDIIIVNPYKGSQVSLKNGIRRKMAGSDSDDEAYEDALESVHSNKKTEMPSLEESIEEAAHALDLFLQNKFNDALECMKPWAHASMYYALGKSTVLFMQAMLTLEANEIEKAMEGLRQAVDVCNRRRKKNTMAYVTKMIKRPDYNSYTEEEVHAELCYAECLLQVAILTFVEDQSLVNFVKGGLRIRACYSSYKECMHIVESRSWDTVSLKKHFESGVRMGVGAFNLMISQLPSRVLKLLEFIGFSGNRVLGLKELDEGYEIKGSLRSPLCALILVAYHTIVTYIFGSGDGDIDQSERIITEMLEKYPEAALFIFFSGRVKQLKGQVNEAIETYQKSINVQHEWKQFHYLCYWELLWCNCFKCDWKEASVCSDILRRECRWSPAIYTYVHASMLYMIYEEKGEEDQDNLKEEITELMKKVPGLKQRLAGKSIPLEKYVVRKSQKFISQDGRLLLPAVELIYIWNSFPMIANSPELANQMLELVEKTLSSINEAKDSDDGPLDDYCLALLLCGMCFKCLGCPLQAEENFKEVLKYEKRVKEDIYLVPFAMAELGFMLVDQGCAKEAKERLDPARHNYHGYPLETILHFRVHSALRSLRAKDQLTPSPQTTPLPSPEPSPIHTADLSGFPCNNLSPPLPPRGNRLLRPRSHQETTNRISSP